VDIAGKSCLADVEAFALKLVLQGVLAFDRPVV
jgi:hypothetical protein